MKDIAKNIVSIVSDYRAGTDFIINEDRVLKWINQFEESDRVFLLNEVLYILPNSYLSEERTKITLGNSFDYLKTKYNFYKVQEFLDNSRFLNCQKSYKSQTKLLEFLSELANEHLKYDLSKCGNKSNKYWIYFDDVLASGGTFRKELKTEIEKFGVEKFEKEKIKIISIFFFLHRWGSDNSKYWFMNELGKPIANSIDFHRVVEIKNNPRINYFNPNPTFNNAYPKNTNSEWDKYLDSTDADRHREFAYRPDGYPRNEKFFSSAKNRIRYESIILDKGIEIINRIKNPSPSLRPLGFTSPSYKTFGTGSHAFTWRNISNTCPIVYWWESNEWFPLFSVANRGR